MSVMDRRRLDGGGGKIGGGSGFGGMPGKRSLTDRLSGPRNIVQQKADPAASIETAPDAAAVAAPDAAAPVQMSTASPGAAAETAAPAADGAAPAGAAVDAATPGAAAPGAAAPAAENGLHSARFKGWATLEKVVAGQAVLRQGHPEAPVVETLQAALAHLGHDPGGTDGIWGGKTSAALRSFQSSQGLGADAALGPLSMRALDARDAAAGGDAGKGEKKKTPPTPTPDDKKPPTPDVKKGDGEVPSGLGSHLSPDVEQKYEADAQPILAELAKKGGGASGGGDTKGGGAAVYPAWFSTIQAILIGRTGWGETEESGRQLLCSYAKARADATGKPLPGSIMKFFEMLGGSEANQKAAQKAGKHHSGELGGMEGGQNWCAAASNGALTKALADRGLKFAKPYPDQWHKAVAAHFKDKGGVTGWDKTAFAYPIRRGDIISIVAPGTPATGHVVTIVDIEGDDFTAVSGNAGGGGGSIRFEQMRRDPSPPAGYSYSKVVTGELEGSKYRPKAGTCWVVSVQRASVLFEELDELMQTNPSSSDYDARLKTLHLKKI